jgi:catechol 2,3-dioxygenase-like lactoylglutathione lyase family enzyme
VQARSFTHVSVHAHDLDEPTRFYIEIFGIEEILAPDFPFPACWLRVGDLQLHLFESEDPAPQRHHFGLVVNDFEATHEKVKELGARGLLLQTLRAVGQDGSDIHSGPCGEHGGGQLAGGLYGSTAW